MSVFIFGDTTLDNYEYFGDFGKSYEDVLELSGTLHPGASKTAPSRVVARHFGGAYLLARYLSVALTLWQEDSDKLKELSSGEPWKDVNDLLKKKRTKLLSDPSSYADILQLFYRLKLGPDGAYRVTPGGFEGYTLPSFRPSDGSPYLNSLQPKSSAAEEGIDADVAGGAITLFPDDKSANLLFINDGGGGFRSAETNWISALPKSGKNVRNWAVIKYTNPEPYGHPDQRKGVAKPHFLSDLVNATKQGRNDRVVVIANADDLRASGLAISRSLSWEQTLRDIANQIENGRVLHGHMPEHLFVTFDYDAAAYFRIKKRRTAAREVEYVRLVFSINGSEGQYASNFDGSVPGTQTVFATVIAGMMYHRLQNGMEVLPSLEENHDNLPSALHCKPGVIEKMLTYAMIAKRRALQTGFMEIEPSTILEGVLRDEDNRPTAVMPQIFYHTSIFSLPKRPNLNISNSPSDTPPDPNSPIVKDVNSFCHPMKREGDESCKQLMSDQQDYGLSCILCDRPFLIGPNGDFTKPDKGVEVPDFFSKLIPSSKSTAYIDYVRYGKVKAHYDKGYARPPLLAPPVCNFGKIKTISQREIESLRALRRLLDDYLSHSDSPDDPIGIAVFGPPGSGKSFTVKSILSTLSKSAAKAVENAVIECNLSGMQSPEEMAPIFHQARDLRLEGKTPILFFDEFDCSVNSQDYFWLKHFLAPLQDGEFRAGQSTHRIGRSIFIFAGGTSETHRSFMETFFEFSGGKAKPSTKSGLREKKGTDFLSRLVGHIDVSGIESEGDGQIKSDDPRGRRTLMRRALLIRALIEKRAPQLKSDPSEHSEIKIDDNVCLALLGAHKYTHGVRSMEAIVRMSHLRGRTRFTADCLPTSSQLSMHVDGSFEEILKRGTL